LGGVFFAIHREKKESAWLKIFGGGLELCWA